MDERTMPKPIRQAAAIPFRRSPFGHLEILLVSLSGGGWGIPKGGVKKGRTLEDTATDETLEEAGALGQLLEASLGSYAFEKRGKPHEVHVYGLEVERLLARWQEEDRRLRVWVPISEAPRMLRRKALARFLTRLRHRLLTEGSRDSLRLAA
jgi:ADP-ribose pyrophosphatase YjhB (NUDIX family)